MMFGEEGEYRLCHGFGLFGEQGVAGILNLDNFNLLRAFIAERVSIFGRDDFILHGLDDKHGNAARAVPALIPVAFGFALRNGCFGMPAAFPVQRDFIALRKEGLTPVSYTHLTLPTILLV